MFPSNTYSPKLKEVP